VLLHLRQVVRLIVGLTPSLPSPYLRAQDATDHTLWETRYGLLLWLSVLVLVPFDLSTADSYASLGGGSGSATAAASAADGLVATLVSTCAGYLSDPGPVRDAAAVCLAKLLTRPDMEGGRLHSFVNAAVDTLAACVLRPAAAPGGGARAGDPSTGGTGGDLAGVGLFGVTAAAAAATAGGGGEAGAFHAGIGGGGAAASPPVSSRAFLVTGVLQTLAHVAKFGHRRALAGVQGDVFDRVVAITTASSAGASFGTAAGARAAAAGRAGASSGVQLRSSPLMRKLLVKLAARTGLTYLPPRVQPWRYARGSRSLLLNLAAAGVAGTATAAAAEGGHRPQGHTGAAAANSSSSTGHHDGGDGDDNDDVAVPPQMEDIVDALLTGLRDSDTVVRWAAAKGVGRVTGRLPLDLADDVVAAVLALLAPTEGDAAWHGGCLALAELVRRGLLLPKRLPEAVPRVLQALAYDVRRGSHSVGAHVRDAACYVCWAFARAYEPGVMAPHVGALATGMLVTALFDREVNCRRAAAAAFQESVGRQGAGSFPHGLEVLTAADYFTLGNRGHAFTVVAPAVAAFPVYRGPLREHLLAVKIRHWDAAVRGLAARALAALAVVRPVDASWIADVAAPALLAGTTSPELFTRHGCTLALAELVLAVGGVPGLALPPALVDDVRNVVVKAEKARVYTGRGGEAVRAAMCRLIACQCLAGHALSRKAALRLLQTLEECLRHPNGAIQATAAGALAALAAHALGAPEPALLDKLPRSYAHRLRIEDNPALRRGLALALGALPRPLLLGAPGLLDDVVTALVGATRLERVIQKRDAETRRNAAASLAALVRTVGVGHRAVVAVGRDGGVAVVEVAAVGAAAAAPAEGDAASSTAAAPAVSSPLARLLAAEAAQPGLTPAQLQRVLEALVHCTWDYAVDNRGDVGSWVRQAAVEGIEAVVAEVQAAAWAQQQAVAALRSPAGGAAAASFAALPLPSAALHTALLRAFPGDLPPALLQPGAAAAAALASATERPSALATRTGLPLGARVRVTGDAGDGGAAAGVTGRVTHIAAAGAVVEVEVDGGGAASVPSSSVLRLPASAVCGVADGGACDTAVAAIVVGPSPLPASIGSSTTTTAAAATSGGDDARAALLAALTAPGADVLTAYLPPQLLTDVVGAHLRLAAEKLDRLRGAAGEALTRLLHAPHPLPRLPGVPHRERLEAALPAPPGLQARPAAAAAAAPAGDAAPPAFDGGFSGDFGGEDAEEALEETPVPAEVTEAAAAAAATADGDSDDTGPTTMPSHQPVPAASGDGELLQLSLPHVMFPRLAALLPLPAYTASLVTGLVTSVGGLSETVVRHASGALVGWAAAALRDGRDADVEAVALALLALLRPRRKQVRVGGGGGRWWSAVERW
jgi:tubulin-specific chaperone D